MSRIVIATLGSHGDINPYIPIGLGLKSRGHSVAVATAETYRDTIRSAGLEFFPVRPDIDIGNVEIYREIMDGLRGTERIIKKYVMPFIRESYADFELACHDADLVISHPLTYYVPILAEKKRIRWLSTVLAPMVFFSAYDPPILAPIPQLSMLRAHGPKINRPILNFIKLISRSWGRPARDLRKQLGIPSDKDPLFEGQHSPYGVLALFSKTFAEPEPDWPAKTSICGFPFYDHDIDGLALDPKLSAFIQRGTPPLVFTLGSSAVYIPGDFYHAAARAAKKLNRRAVLVAGPQSRELNELYSAEFIFAVPTAPYHWLFPQCCAIVHQGGVGTTAQALRSGKPQLVIPFAHDQFDNADRVARIRAGRALHLKHMDEKTLISNLKVLLESPEHSKASRDAAETIKTENAVASACDIIDSVLV